MSERKIPLLKKTRYAIETLAVYAIYYFFSLFPINTASDIGGSTMRKVGKYLPATKTARRNLEIAFPEKSFEEREQIIIDMWENLGRVGAEYAHLDKILNNIEVVGQDNIEEGVNSGKPLIFISAHIGNWEVGSSVLRKFGADVKAVYRKPNNVGVEKLLQKCRSYGAEGSIAKGADGARQIVSLLKAKGKLGMLLDQKLNEGIAVPFFGKDAMTAPAVAHFAYKFDCLLYPIHVVRTKGANFKVIIYPKMELPQMGNREKDIYESMKEINHIMEDWIRENPAQWLWIHRRWDKSEYID